MAFANTDLIICIPYHPSQDERLARDKLRLLEIERLRAEHEVAVLLRDEEARQVRHEQELREARTRENEERWDQQQEQEINQRPKKLYQRPKKRQGEIKDYISANRDLSAREVVTHFMSLGMNRFSLNKWVSRSRRELGVRTWHRKEK